MATEETSQETEEPIEASPQEQEEELHCPKCGSVLTRVETPTGITYRCPKCGRMVRPVERGGGEEEKEEKEIAPPDVEARKFVVSYLVERLDSVYGIDKKKVAPIAETVRDNPQIALNQAALYWHIKQLAAQANNYQLYLFISGLFNKLHEKGLLAGAQPWPVMGMPGQQQQIAFPMFPQQQSMQQPFNPFSPFTPFQQQERLPQTQEEFDDLSERRTRRRRDEERREEEHKRQMALLDAELKNLTESKGKSAANVVTIVEPMRDGEGNLLKDEKGNVLFRKITGPREQVRGSTSDDEFVKFKRYKELFKSDLDEAKIRAIIKEEVPAKEAGDESLTAEDVRDAAKEAALSVVAVTKQEEKEERRHKEVIEAIAQSGSSKVVAGYKDDAYRLIGQGLTEIAKKEPIKIIIEGAEKILKVTPAAKELEEGAREGIFTRVHPKFVAEQ